MKIIVLTITQYKEKDAIIEGIGEEGSITFLVKSLFSPKSKNSGLNNPLVIADIELQEGNFKYPVLKSSSILLNPMKVTNDYYYLSSLLLIDEATRILLQDEEKGAIFDSLAETITLLKNAKNIWPVLLTYFALIFKISGYEFEVNKCVRCGTKSDIVTFSFKEGGFICRNCAEIDTERDLSKEQMLTLRSAFLAAQNISSISFDITKEDALVILNKFNEFIIDSYGTRLKGFALIDK